jgi:nitroreductase
LKTQKPAFMNYLNTLFERRSIRKYTSTKVEAEKIHELLRAAMYAPSAVNKQPWHFIVIDDRALMDQIMNIHQNASMLQTASHAILICGDEKLQHDKGYWVADCGAATENLLLAAKSLGLGSCWIGIYPRENRMQAFREMFQLPNHINPFALVSLGYADEEKPVPERFKPERIYYNTWGNNYLL